MLAELSIRNLAVIEAVELQFDKGFQIFTGETGTGKSMIIGALTLLSGGRASTDLIRHGADKAEIEAQFDLPSMHPVWDVLEEQGIEAAKDDPIVIRREVQNNGKSNARINGQLVNAGMLKKVAEWLVNIHGQHEHQSLLKTDMHLHWLDMYAGKELAKVKENYQTIYSRYRSLRDELNALQRDYQEQWQKLDLYRFQLNELEQASLVENEDVILEQEKEKLAHAEKLYQASAKAYQFLYGQHQALETVSSALEQIESISQIDPEQLGPLTEQVREAYYQLEDASYRLREYRDDVEFDPDKLQMIEERMDLLRKLSRKYGSNVAEMLKYYTKIKEEVSKFENKDEIIDQLEQEMQTCEANLTDAAAKLSQKRRQAAKKLARELEQELLDLHMETTRFEVSFQASKAFTQNGTDDIEFMISPNPGEPLRPLQKIASGGELSRLMLALKTIFSRLDEIPVLIFDEIDTGVSGKAAQAIALKLARLAAHVQVFSITHLPQMACMADTHFEINKRIDQDRTYTIVNRLDYAGKIRELSRMLGGAQVTETTEHHAKEMLVMAAEIKEERKELQ